MKDTFDYKAYLKSGKLFEDDSSSTEDIFLKELQKYLMSLTFHTPEENNEFSFGNIDQNFVKNPSNGYASIFYDKATEAEGEDVDEGTMDKEYSLSTELSKQEGLYYAYYKVMVFTWPDSSDPVESETVMDETATYGPFNISDNNSSDSDDVETISTSRYDMGTLTLPLIELAEQAGLKISRKRI